MNADVGDNTVEAGALVAITVLTSGKLAEVLRSLRHNIVVKLENYAARR
jgi:hypothetical protein